MYVIGRNKHGEFGFKNRSNISTWTPHNQHVGINIINVACGNGYNIFVDNNGNYFAAGNNSHGECSVGKQHKFITTLSTIPMFQNKQIRIKNVFTSITGSTTFWLTHHNQIYGTGWNNQFQLGIKKTQTKKETTPILINNLIDLNIDIVDIKSAFNYSLCLSSIGEVFSTPFSKHGGHGHGTERKSKAMWIKIKQLQKTKIIKIQTGYYHSLFLQNNGTVWCCGKNTNGQLGLGNQNTVTLPTRLKYFTILKIKDIKCGGNHNLMVSVNNTLFVFGANKQGQCGDGTTNDIYTPKQIFADYNFMIKNIACGRNHSMFSTDNKHFLFGNNYWNQCIPSDYSKKKIVSVPYLINKHFENKKIKKVYLGYDTTIVMVEEYKINDDDDEKKTVHVQNNDEEKEEFKLKQALLIIKDEIIKFKQKYDQSVLNDMMTKNADDIVNKASSLNKTIVLYTSVINDVIKNANELHECIQNTRDQINELSQPDVSNYKNWNVQQILIWIKTLENGRFIKYIDKLENGLIKCEVTGDVLPDIDKNELANKYFDIKPIKIRRDLANYFKNLETQIQQNDEGNVTNIID